jgi:hypothetical protein
VNQNADFLTILAQIDGQRWSAWLSPVVSSDIELSRALKFVAAIVSDSDPRELKRATAQYIGHARSPSASSCSKLALRTHWIQGLLTDPNIPLLSKLNLAGAALERLMPACEAADDKHGVFKPAVRKLIANWLKLLESEEVPAEFKTHLLFNAMLSDQCSLVDASWWWNAIQRAYPELAVRLSSDMVESMPTIDPANQVSWKSYAQRWVRMRLKGYLEHVGENAVLAELLKRSAIDDFEAARAVELLHACGRGRDALQYAEHWMRVAPNSPVLAEALIKLYLADGWDNEAYELAVKEHQRDPHERWTTYIRLASKAREN